MDNVAATVRAADADRLGKLYLGEIWT